MALMKKLNGYEVCDASLRAQVNGITTSGTGEAYTATVNGITELANGVGFTLIPHVTATSATPTLNVNGSGPQMIARRTSGNSMAVTAKYVNTMLMQSVPVHVTYYHNGNIQFWLIDDSIPDVNDGIVGTLPVANGGTGATTASAALNNLGITWGTSAAPSTGTPNTIYIQIN